MSRYDGTTQIDPADLNVGDIIRTPVCDETVEQVRLCGPDPSIRHPIVEVTTDWTRRKNVPAWKYGRGESLRVLLVRHGGGDR